MTKTYQTTVTASRDIFLGTYHYGGKAHLHRAKLDFRYNRRAALEITDTERQYQLLGMIEGKRITYRWIGEASYAKAKSA